jgi:hypothetical protein
VSNFPDPIATCQVIASHTRKHYKNKIEITTSMSSLLCNPKTDPMRCERGWLPKSLLTYLKKKSNEPPN